MFEFDLARPAIKEDAERLVKDAMGVTAACWRGAYDESRVRSRLPVLAVLRGFSCALAYDISDWDDTLTVGRRRRMVSVRSTVRWHHERIRLDTIMRHISVD